MRSTLSRETDASAVTYNLHPAGTRRAEFFFDGHHVQGAQMQAVQFRFLSFMSSDIWSRVAGCSTSREGEDCIFTTRGLDARNHVSQVKTTELLF